MSGIRSITRGPTVKGYATPNSAPLYVDSDDNRVKCIPAGTGTTEVVLQENGAGSAEVVITTKAVTAAESGKTFFLNLAAGFVVTLPAVAAGLRYRFVVSLAPSAGSITIVCAGALFKGHVLTTDVNSATDPDFDTTAVATITLVTAKCIAGDWVEVECDGTNWFYSARCSLFDAITGT